MPVPDMSHVEQFVKHPTGRHAFMVDEVTEAVRESDGESIAKAILVPIGADAKSRPNMMVQFTLSESWLWKLKSFIEALGLPVNGGYTFDRCKGKKVIAYIIHTESKGKTYANVNEWEAYDDDAELRPGLGTQNPTQSEDMPF